MIYKIINKYGKDYIIYGDGKLFDIEKGEYKKMFLRKNGYCAYFLPNNGEKKFTLVHRLVAEAFLPNPNNLPCVDHINTVKNDNRVENLRWVTQQENILNPITYDRINNAKKITVIGMNKNGEEVCRFNSMKDAVKAGYRHVSECVNGKRIMCNNLYWKKI